jgi:glutamate/tyrosine decarboxylase-like PLP-dependent enzyme
MIEERCVNIVTRLFNAPQVVWEEFARYWEVEPRYIEMEPNQYTITPKACD